MAAYQEARNQILRYIKDHSLHSGDKLPTEASLCQLLGVSRLTLREALNSLKSDGMIISIQGKGTFLSMSGDHIANTLNSNTSVTEMIRRSGYAPGTSFFEKRIVKADAEIAAALQVSEKSDVMVCVRIRTADGENVVVSEDFLAPRLASVFLGLGEKDLSIYRYIEKHTDLKIGSAITEISPVMADKKTAESLGIKPGSPLMFFSATANDMAGSPLVYAREYFRADKFRFLISRGR